MAAQVNRELISSSLRRSMASATAPPHRPKTTSGTRATGPHHADPERRLGDRVDLGRHGDAGELEADEPDGLAGQQPAVFGDGHRPGVREMPFECRPHLAHGGHPTHGEKYHQFPGYALVERPALAGGTDLPAPGRRLSPRAVQHPVDDLPSPEQSSPGPATSTTPGAPPPSLPTPVAQPVVHPVAPALPELDLARDDHVAAPEIGHRRIFRPSLREFPVAVLQLLPAADDRRLPGGPGADAGAVRAAAVIGRGGVAGEPVDAALHPDLAADHVPREDQGSTGVLGQIAALAGLVVGEERETLLVGAFQQNCPGRGSSPGATPSRAPWRWVPELPPSPHRRTRRRTASSGRRPRRAGVRPGSCAGARRGAMRCPRNGILARLTDV